MKGRVLFLISYYCFWLLVFWIFKGIFLFYHSSIYSSFSLWEIGKIFLYGSQLDISFAGYITLLPVLLTALSNFGIIQPLKKVILYYTAFLLIIISILSISDLEIFKWWGFRIDSSLFKYLSDPAEVAASVSVSPVFLLFTLIVLFSVALIWMYFQLVHKRFELAKLPLGKGSVSSLFNLALIPILLLGIRGGFQLSPINQSAVCFSNNNFLNQAAINTPWNFCYSILENNYNEANPFIEYPEDTIPGIMSKLYPKENESLQVIKNEKVNILLIIWESFSGKNVESLGGKKGITPGFEKLIREGVFFNNIYASGDRSDKGLISLLSAFPAQPTTSIMTKTTKAAKLPSITSSLKKKGYKTSFYYAGEPEFANIKSYLLSSGFENIISKQDFPEETWNSKWGAHDEVAFARVLQDLKTTEDRTNFTTLFTLSSHEPFEIPSAPLLKGTDEESLYLNSIHYTDSCLYDFIQKAQKEKWWDNTLVIITADHGHRLPGNGIATHLPDEFRIPMLWLGGAITKKDTIISKIGNQTDLANTLLTQLGINSPEFQFSKDLLGKSSIPFSYYSFNNGFGFITPEGKYVMNNISKSFLVRDSGVTEESVNRGKAYLQFSFQEYLNK